jgi:iron complex outermembrane receptor protein
MINKHLLLAATGLAWSLTAVPSIAQEIADAAPTRPNMADSGEIVVTARKRQESSIKVPVIADVLTTAKLDQFQVTTLEDVTKSAPGFVIGQSVLENGMQVSIRGVGTTSLDPGIDQSVSLVIDGVQFTQGNAYSSGLFDMQQIEVLKGPQALFFGKNSPGGVVSIRTADPGDKLEAVARGGYEFEDGRTRLEGTLSGPATDTLGLRLAAAYTHSAGDYFENQSVIAQGVGAQQPGSHFGKGHGVYVRGTAVFKPASNFSARLKLNYTDEKYNGGGAFQLTGCPDGFTNYLPSIGIPVPSFYSPKEDCKANRTVDIAYMDPAAFGGLPNNGVPYTAIRQAFGSLELNYELRPHLTLTSVTGYYDLKSKSMINGSYFGAYADFVAVKDFHRHDVTEELRLASDFTGPFNFLAGGFYQGGNVFDGATLQGDTLIGFPAQILAGTFDIHIDSFSGFAQGRFKFTPQLELSAGVRYTDEKRSIDMTTVFDGATLVPTAPEIHSKNWSPEVTLTWTPTDDLTLFGSFKQAYKSGSYNIVQPIFPGTDNSYGDEKIRGGEIGIKSRLADRQLYVNLAGYYYDYTGLQVGINEPAVNGIPTLSTLNAGSARIYGVDFDFNYHPASVPGLSIYAAANWNKAKFTSFVGAPCAGGQTASEGCDLTPRVLDPSNGSDAIALASGNYFTSATGAKFQYAAQDLTGTPLSRAPEWQLTGGVDYDLPLGRDTLKLGVSAQYSSRYDTNLGTRADYFQPAFAKFNANVTLVGPEDHWELAFIGNNLTDKLTTGTCFNANYAGGILFPGEMHGGPAKGPAGSDEVYCSYSQGRELWLRVTMKG